MRSEIRLRGSRTDAHAVRSNIGTTSNQALPDLAHFQSRFIVKECRANLNRNQRHRLKAYV